MCYLTLKTTPFHLKFRTIFSTFKLLTNSRLTLLLECVLLDTTSIWMLNFFCLENTWTTLSLKHKFTVDVFLSIKLNWGPA